MGKKPPLNWCWTISGGYTFAVGDADYVEHGTFEPAQDSITFTADGGEGMEPMKAVKENYTLQASFKYAEEGPEAEWLFYDEAVQGKFSGSTMVAEAYVAVLDLTPDGRYELSVIDEETAV